MIKRLIHIIECIFINSALKIQCHIVINTLLQTAFLVILPTEIKATKSLPGLAQSMGAKVCPPLITWHLIAFVVRAVNTAINSKDNAIDVILLISCTHR